MIVNDDCTLSLCLTYTPQTLPYSYVVNMMLQKNNGSYLYESCFHCLIMHVLSVSKRDSDCIECRFVNIIFVILTDAIFLMCYYLSLIGLNYGELL